MSFDAAGFTAAAKKAGFSDDKIAAEVAKRSAKASHAPSASPYAMESAPQPAMEQVNEAPDAGIGDAVSRHAWEGIAPGANALWEPLGTGLGEGAYNALHRSDANSKQIERGVADPARRARAVALMKAMDGNDGVMAIAGRRSAENVEALNRSNEQHPVASGIGDVAGMAGGGGAAAELGNLAAQKTAGALGPALSKLVTSAGGRAAGKIAEIAGGGAAGGAILGSGDGTDGVERGAVGGAAANLAGAGVSKLLEKGGGLLGKRFKDPTSKPAQALAQATEGGLEPSVAHGLAPVDGSPGEAIRNNRKPAADLARDASDTAHASMTAEDRRIAQDTATKQRAKLNAASEGGRNKSSSKNLLQATIDYAAESAADEGTPIPFTAHPILQKAIKFLSPGELRMVPEPGYVPSAKRPLIEPSPAGGPEVPAGHDTIQDSESAIRYRHLGNEDSPTFSDRNGRSRKNDQLDKAFQFAEARDAEKLSNGDSGPGSPRSAAVALRDADAENRDWRTAANDAAVPSDKLTVSPDVALRAGLIDQDTARAMTQGRMHLQLTPREMNPRELHSFKGGLHHEAQSIGAHALMADLERKAGEIGKRPGIVEPQSRELSALGKDKQILLGDETGTGVSLNPDSESQKKAIASRVAVGPHESTEHKTNTRQALERHGVPTSQIDVTRALIARDMLMGGGGSGLASDRTMIARMLGLGGHGLALRGLATENALATPAAKAMALKLGFGASLPFLRTRQDQGER